MKINKVAAIQPENEFLNPFGDHQFTMGRDYMLELCQIIDSFLPNVPILLNNAGISRLFSPASLSECRDMVLFLQSHLPNHQFLFGVDLYEEHNFTKKIPGLNMYPDSVAGLNMLYSPNLITNVLDSLEDAGVIVEATELQFERWLGTVREHPPGSLFHLQYMLIRYMNSFLRDQNQVVRVWGIEDLLEKIIKQPDNENIKRVIYFFKYINNLRPIS